MCLTPAMIDSVLSQDSHDKRKHTLIGDRKSLRSDTKLYTNDECSSEQPPLWWAAPQHCSPQQENLPHPCHAATLPLPRHAQAVEISCTGQATTAQQCFLAAQHASSSQPGASVPMIVVHKSKVARRACTPQPLHLWPAPASKRPVRGSQHHHNLQPPARLWGHEALPVPVTSAQRQALDVATSLHA
jgi:hypothetical protein